MTKIICLDAGHGGTDPGASGHGAQEKTFSLDRVLRVKEILENEYDGATVILTRSNDSTVSLSERSSTANSAGADIFVSDHKNAFDGSARGFESFVYNGSIGEGTRDLQNKIHDKVASVMSSYGVPNRGKKSADFHVLRETSMSAVLLEEVFIDNLTDNNLMRESAFKEAYCRAVVEGIADHLNLSSGGGKTKMVVVKVDTLNVRSRPSWEDSAIAGTVSKGEAFTVMDRVNVPGDSTDMYLLKSGLYITTSPTYVDVIYV